MSNTYSRNIDEALDDCPRCRKLADDPRTTRRTIVLAEIATTQSRVLEPLPPTAWPLGRPWATTY